MENEAGLALIKKYFGDFTPQQEKQFSKLGELYADWNQKINVISRKDMELLYEKHVLHSLAIAAVCNFKTGARVLDIGTGGGFPGIPLAIFFPDVHFLLADSIGKKIKVVTAVAEALELENITAVHTRVEGLKGQKFHFAVSRAVAPLKELWQWAKPLIAVGKESEELGNGLICLKGGDLNMEISESNTRPSLTPVKAIFPEPYFEDKFLVYVRR